MLEGEIKLERSNTYITYCPVMPSLLRKCVNLSMGEKKASFKLTHFTFS